MATKKPLPIITSTAKAKPKSHGQAKPTSKPVVEPAKSRNNVIPKSTKGSKNSGKQDGSVKSGRKQGAGLHGGSTYDVVISENICDLIAEGIPLRQICRMAGMPAWRTVYNWRAAHPDFEARIARAREAGFDAIAEETLAIADDTTQDTITGDNGDRANTEWISRSKLRIETRLKLLAKWDPKRYGDKIDVNHGGQKENPLTLLMQQIAGKTLKPVANPEDDE